MNYSNSLENEEFVVMNSNRFVSAWEHLPKVRQAFQSGQQRYWIHGYATAEIREVLAELRQEFPDVRLEEISKLDIAVFCETSKDYHILTLWKIADERQNLLDNGQFSGLPV